MCIAIYKPENKFLTKKEFYNCDENNNDGIGLLYINDGEIQVNKFINDVDSAYKLYKKHENKSMVLHFRIGTSGTTDINNCHPFRINDNLWFCHNGILDIDVPFTSLINDTQIYAKYLRALPHNFLNNWGMRHILSLSAMGNKLIFMNKEGRVDIINEELGHWEKGIWFSNKSYSYGASAKRSKKNINYEHSISNVVPRDYYSEYEYDYNDHEYYGGYAYDNIEPVGKTPLIGETPPKKWENTERLDAIAQSMEENIFCAHCGYQLFDLEIADSIATEGIDTLLCENCLNKQLDKMDEETIEEALKS